VESGGLIQAHGPDREATLRFKSTDQRSTRVHIDIFTGERARDISSEEALSRHIEGLIAGKELPSLEEMTAKMIPVHQAPHPGSRIIAYLAGGTVVSITSDQTDWSNVVLPMIRPPTYPTYKQPCLFEKTEEHSIIRVSP
jgi:hypothetical protein